MRLGLDLTFFVLFCVVTLAGSEHTRSLFYAATCFVGALVGFIAVMRDRDRTFSGQLGWSSTTCIVASLMFAIWGLCYLGSAYDWPFIQSRRPLLHITSTALVIICVGIDYLRVYLPSARVSGDQRLLRIVTILFMAVVILVGLFLRAVLS